MRRLLLAGLLTLGLASAASAQQSGAAIIAVPARLLTCGSATGVTCTDFGTYAKVTVASSAFACAATTCDVTLVTLPAKTKLSGVVADLTQTFACTATCVTATLSATVGITAGGNELLLSLDMDAATGQFGLSTATSGASLVASAVQGGTIPSWSATTTVQTRLTSAVGNIGAASVSNLSQGSITFYLVYRVLQ